MDRTPSRIPHPPMRVLQRRMPGGDEALFSSIREHAQRGDEVRVQRSGSAPYSIVANGTLWLARPIGGSPIGSFHTVAAAVLAADAYMAAADDDRAQREHDFGGDDDHPRGAA